MNNWRKRGDKCNQELARIKSNNHYRKPHPGRNSNSQQNIPYWEKRFVSSVGSLSWKKFLQAKEFTHSFYSIMEWEDSAGEEAFKAAKDRFYAQFHGLPCDTEVHNPDLYIDKIDWYAQVDHNLILDLESEVVPDSDNQHEPVLIFGDALPNPYKEFTSYGWGDGDEKMKKSIISDEYNRINWDNYIVNGRITWDDREAAGGNDKWPSDEKENKAGDEGGNDWWVSNENENDNKAGDEGWNTNTYDKNNYYSCYVNVNHTGDEGGNDWWVSSENDNKAGDEGWNTNIYDDNNCYPSYGYVNNIGDQDGKDWWVSNESDNKAGDGGWNTNTYENNAYTSYGNGNIGGDEGWNTNMYGNNKYYPSYGNENNKRCISSHKTWRFRGNNNQGNRSWKNNGNWKKSSGQSYGNQHGHGSTILAHGSQRIQLHP